MNPQVAAVFDAYPQAVAAPLRRLRDLILETAAETPGVGALEETLKWGQASYLTSVSRSGSTIRIDAVKAVPGRYALYVNCKTDLAATLRDLYGEALTVEGQRALVFEAANPPDEAMLRHCIALALTYHRRKTRTIA